MRYVPDLAESIYSLFLHVQLPGHGLESTFHEGLFINFPDFRSKAIIGKYAIYLDAKPYHTSDVSRSMSKVSIPTNSSSSAFCCNIKRLQEEVTQETTKLDDILRSLRRYYAEIKTKRQLGLNVPAGFRSSTSLQKMYKNFTPPRRSDQLAPLDIGLEINQSSSTPLSCDINDDLPLDDSTTNLSNQPSSVPLIRSLDKVSSSLPATITMTEDYIRSCVGFCGIDLLKKHMSTLYQDTVKIDSLPQDAVLDAGGTATLRKKCRNTSPVPRPLAFGDVFHVDIVFGPEVSIGNIHYGLLFTDRFSCPSCRRKG